MNCLGSGVAVFDGVTSSHLLTLIGKGNEQLLKLQDLNYSLSNIKNQLGGSPNSNILNIQVTHFSDWLVSLANLTQERTSALETLPSISSQDVPQDMDILSTQISNHLFPSPGHSLSISQYQTIQDNRNHFIKSSAITGLALSEIQQTSLAHSQKGILTLSKTTSDTVHQDLIHNNQWLSIIASELRELRKVQAKQLEILSNIIMQMTGNVFDRSGVSSTKSNRS